MRSDAAGRRASGLTPPALPSPPVLLALGGTLALLAARLWALPSALVDAATGLPPEGVALGLPLGHLLTTPFAAAADAWTFSGARQLRALAAWIASGYWLGLAALALARRIQGRGAPAEGRGAPGGRRDAAATARRLAAGYLLYLLAWAAFIAWAVLSPRAMARLEARDPDLLIVDFHSHTSHSWDGRRAFTPARNARWHGAAGFTAGFITDHHEVAGARAGKEASARTAEATGYRSLAGEEVGVGGAHVVLLGGRAPAGRAPYEDSPAGVARLLGEAGPVYGALAVMSLPEYWRNHPRERWEEFASAGAAGFEISNGAPKALDFPAALRAEAVDLCRRRGLFVAAATDAHGWGRAAFAWNLVRLPGHAAMDPERLETALLERLRRGGFGAAQVIARVRGETSPRAAALLDPPLALWTAARAFTWPQTLACLVWLWAAALSPRMRSIFGQLPSYRP